MLGSIAHFIIYTIQNLGYPGIAMLMGIESACIPLPSEIIMPFSGYLALIGHFTIWGTALAGAIGSVLGSLIAYAIGAQGGRPFIEKYGRYILIRKSDLDSADRWFNTYGDLTILFGRMLPVVRTFIALPAGISRMSLWRFNLYTFIGSFIWCYFLAWIGFLLGRHWNQLETWFHRFDAFILSLLIISIIVYIYRHFKKSNTD